MKLYIDADVWLNFWQDEMLGFIPASHYLEELLEKALREKWILVISGAVKKEIYRKKVASQDLEAKLSDFKKAGLLEEIEAEEKDIERADNIYRERKLHRSDALRFTCSSMISKNLHRLRTKEFPIMVLGRRNRITSDYSA